MAVARFFGDFRAKRKAAVMFTRPIYSNDVADPVQIARGAFGYLSAERPDPVPDAAAQAAAAALISAAQSAHSFAPDPEAAILMRFAVHDLALMPLGAPHPDAAPMARTKAAAAVVNLRRGVIDLSSLYGPDDLPMARLRDPAAPARMLSPKSGGGAMPLPADPRNHLSRASSRMHRALINLHNMAVDDCDDPGVVAAGPNALFSYARAEVRMLVQWLIVNRALPALCPKAAMDAVAGGRTPLFTRMVTRMGGGVPPVPFEALLAALPLISGSTDNMGALLDMGRRITLPSGQETVRAVNRALGGRIAELTDGELRSGPAAKVMTGAMMAHTPLWLYLLREAEERGEPGCLGPIGGHVAVQSIAGLIMSDPYCYWLRPGNTGGRWRPEDGVLRVNGRPIDSIAWLMAAATL